MKFRIVCVGKLKEKYWANACAEYIKRLSKFHEVEVIEVGEEKIPRKYSSADIAKVQVKECLALDKHIKGFFMVLDEKGQRFNSENFAKKLKSIAEKTFIVTFVIGGSFGLSESFKSKAHLKLSFSDFTFPHQLMRVVLLEQLYRVSTINNNIPYAK